MKKDYKTKTYGQFQKWNRKAREEIRPNPFSGIEEKGLGGKVISSIGNKAIKEPVHKLVWNVTGLLYNPKKDSPYKGSIIYTIVDYMIYGILGLFVLMLGILFF